MLLDGPVQIAALAAHLDVGLVDPDRAAMRFADLPQSLLDQRRIGEHPAVLGGLVHFDAALQKELLDVSVAQRVAQVPGDGLDNERRLVVLAFEAALGALLQRRSDSGQDHGPAPEWSDKLDRYA